MKIHGAFLGIILLVILLVGGCSEQSIHRSYTNTMYGFSFNPPSGWQQIDNISQTIVVCFSPIDFPNITLTISVPFSLSEGRALSTFADQVEENLSESGMNYTILSRDWRSIPNAQGYEIAYTFERDRRIEHVKQIAILRTRTVFLFTFTALNTMYNLYLTDVDQSIDTFL